MNTGALVDIAKAKYTSAYTSQPAMIIRLRPNLSDIPPPHVDSDALTTWMPAQSSGTYVAPPSAPASRGGGKAPAEWRDPKTSSTRTSPITRPAGRLSRGVGGS